MLTQEKNKYVDYPPEKKQKIDVEILNYNLRALRKAHKKLINDHSKCEYQKKKVSSFLTKMQVCNGGMQTHVYHVLFVIFRN